MKELSLNILDIAQNSIAAGASLIEICLEETESTLEITVTDDGCGMTREIVERVSNPFTTTRTTRKVGLGIPFFKMEAEMTGGHIEIDSKPVSLYPETHGTVIKGLFYKSHLDYTPLGDIVSTLCTLIHGADNRDFVFCHSMPGRKIALDTRELRTVLGTDIPLSSPEIISWIHSYLKEQYS